jgi:hypothetical protein
MMTLEESINESIDEWLDKNEPGLIKPEKPSLYTSLELSYEGEKFVFDAKDILDLAEETTKEKLGNCRGNPQLTQWGTLEYPYLLSTPEEWLRAVSDLSNKDSSSTEEKKYYFIGSKLINIKVCNKYAGSMDDYYQIGKLSDYKDVEKIYDGKAVIFQEKGNEEKGVKKKGSNGVWVINYKSPDGQLCKKVIDNDEAKKILGKKLSKNQKSKNAGELISVGYEDFKLGQARKLPDAAIQKIESFKDDLKTLGNGCADNYYQAGKLSDDAIQKIYDEKLIFFSKDENNKL